MRRMLCVLAWALGGTVACGPAETSDPAEASTPLIETAQLRAGPDPELEAAAVRTADALHSLVDDFAVLELAARTQTAFQLRDDGAEVELRAVTSGGEIAVQETFTLRPSPLSESVVLSAADRDGHTVRRFELDVADTQRMRDVRRTLAALKESAPGENQLAINAVVHGCLADGYEPPDTLNLAIYLKTRPDQDFFPFVQEQALTMTDTPFAAQFWTPCASAS